MNPTRTPIRRAWRFVLAISVVSLFADIVYEGAHSVNGQYLASLGASAFVVGSVAGLGELAAYGLRLLTGPFADRTRAYWPIVALGYSINLLAVPLTALAGNWPLAAMFILLERTGKAIRNPARDALFAHSATLVGAGKAWGIHEALDETGAALGPAVVALVLWLRGGFQLAYAVLLLPACISLGILVLARRVDPSRLDASHDRAHDGRPAEGAAPKQRAGLDRRYWFLLAGGILVALGFADFSLIAYHFTKTSILAVAAIPLLYGFANAGNALGAYLFGHWFDKTGAWLLPALSIVQIGASFLLFSSSTTLALCGMAGWALGVTLQQTLVKAHLTGLLGTHNRARGFGRYDGWWGIASFAGGALLGWLYDADVGVMVLVSTILLVAAVPLFGLSARAGTSAAAPVAIK